jgi:hypothetical protein
MFLGIPNLFNLSELEIMCLRVNYKKKYDFFLHPKVKSLKKGVGSGVRSGSVSQRYGSPEPDRHQNITDPQHLGGGACEGGGWEETDKRDFFQAR